jgi:biopolymer transport protein ExbB/TolQ
MGIASYRRLGLLCSAVVLAAPVAAQAGSLTPVMVFQNAAIPVQLIMLGLVAATLAAIGVLAMKLAKPAGHSGGSAYLSGLRMGGPLAGILGAAYTLLVMFLFISGTSRPVSLNALAPGFAEALVLILLGFASGAIATICKWAVDARIDRAVLKS